MNVEILIDADAVARKAAEIIAAEARATVAERGRFIMAVSGGHTPWKMLRALANEKVPWEGVRVVQVDERVAPAGDPDRNLSHLRESLLRARAAATRADPCHASGSRRPRGGRIRWHCRGTFRKKPERGDTICVLASQLITVDLI